MRWAPYIVALFGLAGCGEATAPDGLYIEANAGEGPVAWTGEGERVRMGARLPLGNGRHALVSQTNENDRYELRVDRSRLQDVLVGTRLVFVANGQAYRVSRSRGRRGEAVDESVFCLPTREAAEAAAETLGIGLPLRAHPGHRLEVDFVPYERAFEADEPVLVTMKLVNSGRPVRFLDGHMSRARRDKQFSFTGRRDGEVLADTAHGGCFGGITEIVALRPGRVYTKTVDLREWFDMKPGAYALEGTYRLDLVDAHGGSERVWLDFATARFQLRMKK